MSVRLRASPERGTVILLDHRVVCAPGACRCVPVPWRDGLRVPSTVMVPAGETSAPLPSTVLVLPDVQRGLAMGDLSVVVEPPPAPPKAPAGRAPLRSRGRR
jgi:predicted acyl esterase